MDRILKSFADIQRQCRTISGALRAWTGSSAWTASDRPAFPPRRRKSSGGLERVERRLMMNSAPLTDVYPTTTQSTSENVPMTFSTANNNPLEASSASNLTQISVSHGSLTLSTTGGLTFLNGNVNGRSTVEFEGNATAINAALNGLVFTPTQNFYGSDPLTFLTGTTVLGVLTSFTTNTVPITVNPAPPTVARQAQAAPNNVNGVSTALSVLGADDAGEASLIYSWSAIDSPPAAVAFSASGTNAAQNTTATFAKAGNYTLEATITDPAGLSVTSAVNVNVNQTATSVVVSPTPVTVPAKDLEQFTAVVNDQFGAPMANQPGINWRLTGAGTLTNAGLYLAPATSGTATVTATAGPISGAAAATIGAAGPVDVPAGTETLVSAATTPPPGPQQLPSVAMDSSGSFVVVWESGASGGEVNAQLYNASGAAVGSQFQINTNPCGGTPCPSVAMNAAGQFVVCWNGNGSTVYAKLFSATGTALTPDTLVASGRQGNTPSAVGMAADGSFTVVYEANAPSDNDGIYAQRYTSAGVANGAAILVNTTTAGSRTNPAIATDAQGNSVVTWTDKSSGEVIKAALLPASGAASAEILIGASGGNNEDLSAVGMDGDGNFVVSWIENGPTQGVYTRRYNAAGTALDAAPVLLADSSAALQTRPTVAVRLDGNYVVGWTAGQNLDGNGNGVFAQAFSASGAANGEPFLVNTTTQGNQQDPAAAWFNQNLVLAWDGQGATENNGVYLQRYTTPATADQAPVNTVPASASIGENTPITFSAANGNAITVADADADGGIEQVTLTASAGTLSLGNASAVTITAGANGSALVTFTGTIANLNAALNGLVYTPVANTIGNATLQIATNDLGNTGSGGPLTTTNSIPISIVGPSVVTAAAASPSPVTGVDVNLSVLGTDPGGASHLTYTWGAISGPAGVTFSANGTNAAQETTATFTRAGNYDFQVTIADASGLSTVSSVNVTVDQTLTRIAVSPGSATLNENQTQDFSAVGQDQFGVAMASQPGFTWSSTGVGSVNAASGVYTSPGESGTASVVATSGSVSGAAAVTVVNAPPTVAMAASASPSPVTGVSAALSVLGADDGGEANLIYSWSVQSTPVGAPAPSFSANSSNAAQNTTAVFAAAGSYVLVATITDAGGLSTTSAVTVHVAQTMTSIAVSPRNSSVAAGGGQQFTAAALDQFGAPMASQPSSFTWGATDGMIDSAGNFIAPPMAGPVTITASSSGLTGSTGFTIVGANTAIATPSPVTGNATTLSVLGGAASGVTYDWSAVTIPIGAAAPVFGPGDDSSAAQTISATFSAAGNYTFQVAIDSGVTTTQSVNVTVAQTLSSITVSPAVSPMNEAGQQQFSAVGYDQFGAAMATEPSFSWAVTAGLGSIDEGGVYRAGGSGSAGDATVTASSGSVAGSATVEVTNDAPTIATPAAASDISVNGNSTLLSVLGADDGGESNLTYTWSTIGVPPAAVNYSANDSNSAKYITATFSKAGQYQFEVTITDAEGLSVASGPVNVTVNQTVTSLGLTPGSPTVNEGASQQFTVLATDQFGDAMAPPPAVWAVRSGGGSINQSGMYTAGGAPGTAVVSATSATSSAAATITIPNQPPTVAHAAAASPSPVTGASTSLSVLGADDSGESSLTYTWSAVGSPPTTVTFSANDSNAAKDTTAYFTKAGDYDLRVTITDAGGLSITSIVPVTVEQTATTIAVSPPSATVAAGGAEQFTATATDQFGDAIADPAITWSIADGGGSIDASGLYTAGGAGSATVIATSGAASGSATVTIPGTAPSVAVVAAASPNPVTGTTTNLSVLGADDDGESTLTYTWSAIGSPPAPVIFSVNGSNSAKDTVATFSAAGSYEFLVTIANAHGLTATSSVSVTVNPVLTSVRVASTATSIGRAQTAQFTASALDQFGAPLADQPAFAWSTVGNVGTIDASGFYTAPDDAGGTATIVATAASVSGIDSVQLANQVTASVPPSVSTAAGTPAVFAGSNVISITDADPNTSAVPVSITVSATHGTISFGEIAGLSFSNGAQNDGVSVTFTGKITDVDNALRAMQYIPDAGFEGAGSLRITVNETGTNVNSPSYPVAINVLAPAVPQTSGSSVTASSNTGQSQESGLDLDAGETAAASPSDSASVEAAATGVSESRTSSIVAAVSAGTSAPAAAVHAAVTATPAAAAPAANPAVKTDSAPPQGAPSAAPAAANVPAAAMAVPAQPMVTPPMIGPPDVRVESVPEQVFPFLAPQSEMTREIDAVQQKIVGAKELKVFAGSATMASVGASAAYVIWLLRGGSLLSSLLSILPAWQSIDPLPVLDNFESRKRRRNRMKSDGESLESMVDRLSGRADRADEPAAHSLEHGSAQAAGQKPVTQEHV